MFSVIVYCLQIALTHDKHFCDWSDNLELGIDWFKHVSLNHKKYFARINGRLEASRALGQEMCWPPPFPCFSHSEGYRDVWTAKIGMKINEITIILDISQVYWQSWYCCINWVKILKTWTILAFSVYHNPVVNFRFYDFFHNLEED